MKLFMKVQWIKEERDWKQFVLYQDEESVRATAAYWFAVNAIQHFEKGDLDDDDAHIHSRVFLLSTEQEPESN